MLLPSGDVGNIATLTEVKNNKKHHSSKGQSRDFFFFLLLLSPTLVPFGKVTELTEGAG